MRVLGCIFFLSIVTFLTAKSQHLIFKENGKTGLKDGSGKILIPAQYEAIGWSNKTFSVLDQVTGFQLNGNWGLISITNHIIKEAEFIALRPADAVHLIASKKHYITLRITTGCITTSGKEVIPFQYDGIEISSLRAIAFVKQGIQFKYGLIDFDNKKIISFDFQAINSVGTLRYAVQNFQNKTALFSENGKQLSDFSFDSIASFHNNYAVVYQNYQQGLIDREGKIITPPIYSSIDAGEAVIKGKQNNTWLFLDGQNKLIKKVQADSVKPLAPNLYKLKKYKHIEMTDGEFKSISPMLFSSLDKFKNGKALFSINKKYGLIQKSGAVFIQPSFEELHPGKNYIITKQLQGSNYQWTLRDTLGNAKNSKHYDFIQFNGSLFTVKSHNYWGLMDFSGKEVVACVHDSILQISGGSVVVKFHNEYGIINLKEDWIVTPQPHALQIITDNRYIEFTPHTIFLKSFDGNIIYFSDNRLEIQGDHLLELLPSGAIWKIDLQGRIISRELQPEKSIEKVFPETEGRRAVKKDGKYGFIDSKGRLRVANRYDDVQSFSEGMAAAKILGKWGFISHDDNIIVQPVYEEVTSFQNGIAVVKSKGLYGAINKTGKLVLPIRYQQIKILPDHRLIIKFDNAYGLAGVDGKVLILPKYSILNDLDNGYVIVSRDGKFGLLTTLGLSTIPMIYDALEFDADNNYYLAPIKSDWVKLF